jgi:REP element-mobilizing transposase RayT
MRAAGGSSNPVESWHGHQTSQPVCRRHRDHLVWVPTYRTWVLHEAIRQRVRELFCEIAGPQQRF